MKKIVFILILLLLASCGNVFNKKEAIHLKTSDYFISFNPNKFRVYSFILTNESLKNIYSENHYTTQSVFCEKQGNLNLFGYLEVDNEVKTTTGYVTPISLRICPKDDAYNNCNVTSEDLSLLTKDFQCYFEFSGLLRFDKKVSQTFFIKTDDLLKPFILEPSSDVDEIIKQQAKKASLRNIRSLS